MNQPSTQHLLNGCLYFTTSKLDRLLTRWAEEAFSGSGLAPNYAFAVMLVNEKPGMTQNELAQTLHLSPSTLTRFVDKLESKGWMKRTQEGRQTFLNPTTKGQQQHAELSKSWQTFWERYTKALGVDEGNGLAAELHLAAQRLGQEEN